MIKTKKKIKKIDKYEIVKKKRKAKNYHKYLSEYLDSVTYPWDIEKKKFNKKLNDFEIGLKRGDMFIFNYGSGNDNINLVLKYNKNQSYYDNKRIRFKSIYFTVLMSNNETVSSGKRIDLVIDNYSNSRIYTSNRGWGTQFSSSWDSGKNGFFRGNSININENNKLFTYLKKI